MSFLSYSSFVNSIDHKMAAVSSHSAQSWGGGTEQMKSFPAAQIVASPPQKSAAYSFILIVYIPSFYLWIPDSGENLKCSWSVLEFCSKHIQFWPAEIHSINTVKRASFNFWFYLALKGAKVMSGGKNET